MRRAAFTLLETLLAISITVSVGIAALTMTTLQARIGASARTQESALALVTETVRVLNDDLLLAVQRPAAGRFQLQEQGALRLVTSHRLPGEARDLHEVLWHFDTASGTVLRTATPLHGGETTTRSLGRDWKQFSIVFDHDLLWLHGRIGASDQIWRLPLWTEPR